MLSGNLLSLQDTPGCAAGLQPLPHQLQPLLLLHQAMLLRLHPLPHLLLHLLLLLLLPLAAIPMPQQHPTWQLATASNRALTGYAPAQTLHTHCA